MILSSRKAKSLLRITVATILMLVFCLIGVKKSTAKEKVILQLSWKHQFQFAGYYAALEKGFYADAGFDVEIREAPHAESVVNEILNGNADFAIGDAEILIYYMRGYPIVLIASIFQHSPSVLLVKSTSNINTPQDLAGKVLMLGDDHTGIEILTMLYGEGLKKDQFKIVPKSFSVNDLLSDKVDGIAAYISNEPYFMEKFGIPFRIINPVNYGIDFYSDCLFTSQKILKTKPERVKKFREASMKGWEYALANKEEIAYLIVNKYNSSKTIDHLLYEANEIHKIIKPDFIEIGHTNKLRWQKMAEYLFQLGIIENISSIDDFMYSPNLGNKYLWLKIAGIIAAIILISIIIIYIFHHRLNLTVQKRTREIQGLIKKLEDKNDEIQRINLDLMKTKELARETEENRYFIFSKIINELRNPVNSLIELSEQACKPNLMGEKKQAVCSRIGMNSKIVYDFISDILAISQVGEDEKSSAITELSINSLISTFVSDFNNENKPNHRISVNQLFNIEDSQKMVLVERNILYRILIKLVNNSLKFTEQGSIEIGCDISSPTSLLFWVKDSGQGIKPEVLKKINEFFSNPMVSNTGGIGLGLWVSKTLIQQLNGSIWAESEYGKSSKFYFQVPCVFIDEVEFFEPLDPDIGIDASRLRQKSILILDENFANYNLIKMLSKGSGISLLYTESLNELMQVLRSGKKIDVLLLSTEHVNQSAFSQISEIRGINPSIPVVGFTLKETPKKDFLDLGFNDVVHITALQNQLLESISRQI